MIREEVQIGVSKTKITSESTIRICLVLFCINFGQTGHMMFLDCSYKYVLLYSAYLQFHIYLHV